MTNTRQNSEAIDSCILHGSYYNLAMVAVVGVIIGIALGIFFGQL